MIAAWQPYSDPNNKVQHNDNQIEKETNKTMEQSIKQTHKQQTTKTIKPTNNQIKSETSKKHETINQTKTQTITNECSCPS
jgi:hypothetical protein